MSNPALKFAVFATIALAVGTAFGQQNKPALCLNKFGQKEWAILLKDIDPAKKKTLFETEEMRSSQVESIREMLAFACEAEKVGLAAEPLNAKELRLIRSETIAVAYDRRLAKTAGVPFSRITDAQVARFYTVKGNDADFEDFLAVKLGLLRRGNPQLADRDVTDEEKKQARDLFARIKISEKAASLLGEPFRSTAEVKGRLQQAQFLARVLGEKMAPEISVSDADVARYMDTHPEFDVQAKKDAATKILERAKAGEDFAALANEFSEDPGNIGRDGTKNGGLYAEVPLGMMVPPFEKASLALEPGQISPALVQSAFGFHVIKLEKKDPAKYDVRHILIATTYRDSDGKELPPTVYVRAKLEKEMEAAMIDRIVARNKIVVEDYKPAAEPAVKRPVRKRRS